MKHDDLLKLEEKLRKQYFKTQNTIAILQQWKSKLTSDDLNRTEARIALQQSRLERITASAKSHIGETCDLSKPEDVCKHDFNVEHWILNAKILQVIQGNDYVKQYWSYYARDGDPCIDMEGPNFYYVENIEQLKKAFLNYNAFRQVFVYKDLVFVNQDPTGGWEAWTLKIFGDELIDFESISMVNIIEHGTHDGKTFEQEIEFYLSRTKEQVLKFKKTWSWD
jgi:hypothetical protein